MDLINWLPLAGVVVGAGSTFAATMLTQRKADRRADALWQRERIREAEQRKRDEHARTFEQRELAYLDFISDWRQIQASVEEHEANGSHPDDQPPLSFLDSTLDIVNRIGIYGTHEAHQASLVSYEALSQYVHPAPNVPSMTRADAMKTLDDFREVVRRDLKVPD